MSGLFGSKSQSSRDQRYNSIQLNQSAYGSVVPLVYGTARLAGSLIWYSDFVATPHTQSQGGKGGGGNSTNTTYTYSAALMMLLSEGPIAGIGTVWSGKAVTTLSNLGLTLFNGAGGQAIWGYLTTAHPTQAVPYDHNALVASSSFQLGSSAAMPNLSYELQGLVRYNPGIGVVDAAPWDIVQDYATDPNHGANFNYLAPMVGPNSYYNYCLAMQMFISVAEVSQRAAVDLIKEIVKVTNSATVIDGLGLLHIVPYADVPVSSSFGTYTPDLTPQFSFTDDDYVAKDGEQPVVLLRTPMPQTFNVFNVEYEERGDATSNITQYNKAIAVASDDNDIAQNGQRVAPTESLPSIKTASLARLVGQLLLNRSLFYRNQYKFRVRADYQTLEPMNLVAVTDSGVNANNALCRVIEVLDPAKESDGIELIVEEMPVGPATAPLYNWQMAQGWAANHAVVPGSVNAPYIFNAPPALVRAPGHPEVWLAVTGPNNGFWAGCQVWVSFDNVNYEFAGTVYGAARYGTLAVAVASGADPDTVNTLAVTLSNPGMTMANGSQSDADSLRTLLQVDGEVMAYQTAAFVSSGRYNLTYLRRGQYGSTITTHTINSNWARLDEAIFKLAFDGGLYGQQVWFKFLSFNIFQAGLEALSSVVAYPYTLPSGAAANDATLLPHGAMVVDGNRVYKAVGAVAGWDSDAYTLQAMQNGVFVSWRAGQTNLYEMVGLSSNPTATVSYTSLDYALYNDNAGVLELYESGNQISPNLGTYTPIDVFEIRYDGVTVRYFKNGVLLRAVRAPGRTLYPKVCAYSAGALVVDFRYGPVTSNAIIGGNFLSTMPWVVGNTLAVSEGNYTTLTAGAPGSGIILAGTGTHPYGPYGHTEALWYGLGNGSNGADTGWNNTGDLQGMDPTKTYRSCVWFYYKASGTVTGYFYHGCDGGGATLNLDGSGNANPYFIGGELLTALTPNKWYLSVGFIHGSGYGTVAAGVGGIYDPVTGQKVVNGTEYKMTPAYTYQNHRTFLYYTTTSGVALYLARPRFEEVNGAEPSIALLLSPNGALAYLNQADTVNIVPNAATATSVATPAGVNVIHSGYTTVGSITVGPFPYDTTVVLTATGNWEFLAVRNPDGAFLYLSLSKTTAAPFSAVFITAATVTGATPGQDFLGQFADEETYALPANTTQTYYLMGIALPGSGTTAFQMSNVRIKAEVIKR